MDKDRDAGPTGPNTTRGLRRAIAAIGAIILFAAILFLGGVPGCERTIADPDAPGPRPDLPESLAGRLQAPWDSEAAPDWPMAETLAEASDRAYLPPGEARAAYEGLGYSRVEPLIAGSMVGYLAIVDDAAVLAFRGTDDRDDWIANLSMLSTATPHGSLHRGFHDAYGLVKQKAVGLLREHKPRHLWLTGHSLGGAIAVVCAYDLVENEGLSIDGLMTFGQPMVAGRQLAAYLDRQLLGRYVHFVNESDVVARIPPGYSHFGSLVWFYRGEIRRSLPKQRTFGAPPSAEAEVIVPQEIEPLSQQEFEQLRERIRARNEGPQRLPDGTIVIEGNMPWIKDHGIGLYLEKIRGLDHRPTSQE